MRIVLVCEELGSGQVLLLSIDCGGSGEGGSGAMVRPRFCIF